MRMSRLLLRTFRDAPADAEVASHRLLVRGGYVRRLASGIYTFLPLGLRVLHQVTRIVREEMDAAGAQELLLPALHPVELWERSGRTVTMDDVLIRVHAKGGEFVLAPTHEEVVTATVAGEVDSWRDLPVSVYQVQTKFRDEARPRYGLLRTRELIMKDAYSFDVSAEAMGASYRDMYDAYCRIFARLGLAVTPVEAASGAIGGDVSHEFMVASEIGEDRFARCPALGCGWAASVEAAPHLAEGGACPRCGAAVELVRAVEAGHTFQLGLTYSTKSPGATFTDEAGRELPYWMGCYGMGLSRLVAVLAEEHHDDAGLRWPESVAPYQVHVVALGVERSPAVAGAAERIYAELGTSGTSVLYDDRDASAGVKFADADLLGVPVQVVVGAKGLERGVVEVRYRPSGAKDEAPLDQVVAAAGAGRPGPEAPRRPATGSTPAAGGTVP